MAIRDIFKDVYNNMPSVFTPYVVEYGRNGRYLWELSTDREHLMYGVTVINAETHEKMHDISSGGFTSEDAARSHIEEL